MDTTDIFFDRIITTNSGFGARMDTGDQVYIPASVVRASGVKEGDIRSANLIPNTHISKSGTPWVAVFVAVGEGEGEGEAEPAPAPARPAPTIDDRILEAVCDLGYASTNEVAKEASVDVQLASNALLRLFNKGSLAKADVYARPNAERASFCMWAVEPKHFLGGENQ